METLTMPEDRPTSSTQDQQAAERVPLSSLAALGSATLTDPLRRAMPEAGASGQVPVAAFQSSI